MSAVALAPTKPKNVVERRVSSLREIAFPADMREWAKYDSADDLSDSQVLAEIRRRWPEERDYPTERTVYEWRLAARNERRESRARVWERQFAESARYLVPKCLVSLDKALTEAVGVLEEARGHVDGVEACHRTALKAADTIGAIAEKMLTHLGAPSLTHEADPEAIRRDALAALMAAGQSAAEAEAVLTAFAAGPAAALGAGEE